MTLMELNERYNRIEALERQRLIILNHAKEVRELSGIKDNDYKSVYSYAKDYCDGLTDICNKIVFERCDIETALKDAGFSEAMAICLSHVGLPNLNLAYTYEHGGIVQ